jgi:subtilase family serine protease
MNNPKISRDRSILAALVGAAAAIGVVTLASPASAGQHRHGAIVVEQASLLTGDATARFRCEKRAFDLSQGIPCYGPAAIRAAYGLDALLAGGSTGAGQTIVIVDAFGSPFAESDVKLFDQVFGLPDPPSFQVITMPGTPPFDPNNSDVVGWSGEIALDTQWAHAIAPGANIVLIAAKSDNDQDLIDAVNYAIDHKLGNAISMSFGESELFLTDAPGQAIVRDWSAAFKRARHQRITLLVSSGDQGVDTQGLPTASVSWPASSPLVTSVGGTNLFFGTTTNADPNGTYQSEVVWNDGFGAGGGGVSAFIRQPEYQRENVPGSIRQALKGFRGVPDVAYDGGVVGGVITAWSVPFGPGAFFIFGGTSAGAPQWAGIVADLDQARGRPIGFMNPRIYELGHDGFLKNLSHDITVGNNSFGGIVGFSAAPGFDLATGWGTPSLAKLGGLRDWDDDFSGDD